MGNIGTRVRRGMRVGQHFVIPSRAFGDANVATFPIRQEEFLDDGKRRNTSHLEHVRSDARFDSDAIISNQASQLREGTGNRRLQYG